MSLLPMDFFPIDYTSPLEGMAYRTLNRDFDRSLNEVPPYWLQTRPINECNIGNTIGKVVNDREKFGVDIDVSHFRPDELKVNLRERELVIEGRHDERVNETGSIERHFMRKYMLPEDVNIDTLESHLSDRGILSIWAKKITGEGKQMRNIPIIAAPRIKPLTERKEGETEK